MIYLIGTNHKAQHNGWGSEETPRKKLTSYLKDIVKKFSISLIAEEFSEEVLQKSNATIDTAKDVADKLNIEHLFCDPNTKERKDIGVLSQEEIKNNLDLRGPILLDSKHDKQIKEEQKKYYPIREKFWFGKIKQYLNEDIIFLCGHDHIESFKLLLTNKGYPTNVLSDKIGEI